MIFYSIDFHGLMPLLLEILGNMSIAIISFPVCDVKIFEFNLSFLINPFFRKIIKYFHNEKSLLGEIKKKFS